MAIHKVKSESGRLLAHIRTHANQYVSLSPARRWSPDEARQVAAALAEVVGAPAPVVTADPACPACGEPVDEHSHDEAFYCTAQLAKGAHATPPAVSPQEPPLHGRGSSRVAWVDYARSQGVEVTGTMTREAIRAAVHAARSEARPGEVGGVAVAV